MKRKGPIYGEEKGSCFVILLEPFWMCLPITYIYPFFLCKIKAAILNPLGIDSEISFDNWNCGKKYKINFLSFSIFNKVPMHLQMATFDIYLFKKWLVQELKNTWRLFALFSTLDNVLFQHSVKITLFFYNSDITCDQSWMS